MGRASNGKANFKHISYGLNAGFQPRTEIAQSDVKSDAASWMHWRLVSVICDFEGELEDNQEAALQIAGRSANDPFYIEAISFWNPDMMVVFGTDAQGNPLRFAHHTSQLGYTLIGAPKIHDKAVRVAEALKAGLPQP